MSTGTIKKFIPEKGYGFIARPGQPDVFFHINSVDQKDRLNIEEGKSVEFTPDKDGQGRDRAKEVRLV